MYSKGSNSEFVKFMKKIAAINPTYPTHCTHRGWFKKTESKFRPFSFNISAIKIRIKNNKERPNTNLFEKASVPLVVSELKSKR
jgi:hypothetical protein